jgi:hypothetical protein
VQQARAATIEEVEEEDEQEEYEQEKIADLAARTTRLSDMQCESLLHEIFEWPTAAMLKALFPQAVFIPNQRSIHALIKFHSRTLHSEVSTLIDSGTMESFIFPDLMEHFNIPTHTLPKPMTIRNVDGTENKSGKVTEATDLDIYYQGKKTTHTFFIISLGNDHIHLEMPFLTVTNPNINWTQGTFKGKVMAASMDTHKWKPNLDSKVFKPFVKQLPIGYRHYERSNDPLHFVNIDPNDYISHIDPDMYTYL